MSLENRVQALENELHILKNQIQATLLDIQAYLLTNANHELQGSQVNTVSQTHVEESAAPNKNIVQRITLDVNDAFEDDDEEEPQTTKMAQVRAVQFNTPEPPAVPPQPPQQSRARAVEAAPPQQRMVLDDYKLTSASRQTPMQSYRAQPQQEAAAEFEFERHGNDAEANNERMEELKAWVTEKIHEVGARETIDELLSYSHRDYFSASDLNELVNFAWAYAERQMAAPGHNERPSRSVQLSHSAAIKRPAKRYSETQERRALAVRGRAPEQFLIETTDQMKSVVFDDIQDDKRRTILKLIAGLQDTSTRKRSNRNG